LETITNIPDKENIPVYINYGRDNFLRTYQQFRSFLSTVPADRLTYAQEATEPCGIIVSPRNNSAIPWCNITLALVYAYLGKSPVIIWDDLPFLDPGWEFQNQIVGQSIADISAVFKIRYIKTTEQNDSDLEKDDHTEIERLAQANGIWNVRRVGPSAKLEEYTKLSHQQLLHNAGKIKSLYREHRFDHCIHQSLINNNGGLHKWFANKNNMRVGCFDSSFGKGLVGIDNVPAYLLDLPKILASEDHELFSDPDVRALAICEGQQEFEMRSSARDKRKWQVVGKDHKMAAPESDVMIPLNIFWDAAALSRNCFFEDPHEWIVRTVEFLLSKTDARIVVRQHPEERRFNLYKTGIKHADLLVEKFGANENFRLYRAEDKINTYALIENSKVVLPYTSTIGIEAALMGKIVIIESDVYYGKQPFVIKAKSGKDYFDRIQSALREPNSLMKMLFSASNLEMAWLLYFLQTKCIMVDSEFGLDPLDFDRWTVKGFAALLRDENFMNAVYALISNSPFAYLNGVHTLRNRQHEINALFPLFEQPSDPVGRQLSEVVQLINNGEFHTAISRIESNRGGDPLIFSYPLAFALAKIKQFQSSKQVLRDLLVEKVDHRKADMLMCEINNLR
jgi:hypothetical protein